MSPRRQRRPSDSPALIAFGRQMRRMREAKGIKQETIAHLTQVSGPQVSKIENGKKRATRSFVELVDDYLEAGGALINLWQDLNKDGHPVPLWFDWPKIETDAAMLVTWQHSVMPGLVQTPAYAVAILHGNEAAAEARIARQAILTKKPEDDEAPSPTYLVLLNEHVLHNQVGTVETMREQLEHLIEMSTLPNVTVQVVLGSGEHDGNTGAFVIATMADRSEVAYIETAVRPITTDDPADLSILAKTLVALGSRALTQEMSRELIRKVAHDKWT
ncbi:helix-turn-helix protein [Actinomadura pelletieri DSM 43383]|uniref:Helix-turn-helix protein n=1 Tax=Actinomadura pelletieri DSM 43383 TaxID=1120940 RepID=A0A495R0E1_9ACTN|nr:helix-turn-helix transcriptional regulator [Actinomadura pelletieri]RKS79684.1 helix-turn-helix protein [Actinomadura pelletieri DSM 43383]